MSMDKIEHVVVLMLENRSFDSMLGWLYRNDAPSQFIPPTPGASYRGMATVDPGGFVNQALGGTLSVPPTRGASGFTVPNVDPGEEFAHVNMQFYGSETPKPTDPVTMLGVLADYVGVLQARKYNDADVRRLAPMIMQCFTPGQLPVLNQLARHYAISDAWYASVPSQTNPNRAFLMCGTSNGMVNNGDLETDPQAKALEKVLGMAIGDDRVDAPTIFNALDAAGKDWSVFWQTSYLPEKISTLLTGLPLLIPALTVAGFPTLAIAVGAVLAALQPYTGYLNDLTSGELDSCYTWRLFPHIKDQIPNAAQHFKKMDAFHAQARAGQLPAFSYIEPFWSIAHTTNDNSVMEKLVCVLGNDYHPPSNLLVGEAFVKEVYTSLISNRAAWEKTLLLITFDEFVGVFDHEKDGLAADVVVPPWGQNGQPPFKSPTQFPFNRLGARVPTIMVSPYVQRGTVFRSDTEVPYDHTSLIHTTLKWLGREDLIAGFGARTAAAPTFETAVTLDAPRTDEKDLPFLDTAHAIGDPVRWGDNFYLKNQNGDYLSAFYTTMKVAGGGAVIPNSVLGICVDLDVAANFPRTGGDPVPLSFITRDADPSHEIGDGMSVLIASRETGLGAMNLLGAWRDSHDCYYADEYIDGDNAARLTWTIGNVSNPEHPVRYGDNVYLVNESFSRERLTRDVRWFVESGWITTDADGDYWTVVPMPARV